MFFNLLAIPIMLLLTMACTSAPELNDYPTRQIDRPYTLPKRVATWQSQVGVKLIEGDDSVEGDLSVLNWEQALSDDWTLEYLPLPLALRYQISKTENVVLGARFGTGIGYSSLSGTILEPTIQGYYRHKLADSVALESEISYSRTIRSEQGWGDSESSHLLTGPMFQLDDNKVITPKVGIAASRNSLLAYDGYRYYSGDDKTSIYLPAMVDFTWLFHRQWEYSFDYSLSSVALNDNKVKVHRIAMGLKHYW